MKTFALGLNGKVDCWCYTINENDRGARLFHCINGAWEATYDNGCIFFDDGTVHDSKIIWEGNCPYEDYERAIPWIEEQAELHAIMDTMLDDYWFGTLKKEVEEEPVDPISALDAFRL